MQGSKNSQRWKKVLLKKLGREVLNFNTIKGVRTLQTAPNAPRFQGQGEMIHKGLGHGVEG